LKKKVKKFKREGEGEKEVAPSIPYSLLPGSLTTKAFIHNYIQIGTANTNIKAAHLAVI
jgi:hypothetical protein